MFWSTLPPLQTWKFLCRSLTGENPMATTPISFCPYSAFVHSRLWANRLGSLQQAKLIIPALAKPLTKPCEKLSHSSVGTQYLQQCRTVCYHIECVHKFLTFPCCPIIACLCSTALWMGPFFHPRFPQTTPTPTSRQSKSPSLPNSNHTVKPDPIDPETSEMDDVLLDRSRSSTVKICGEGRKCVLCASLWGVIFH